MFMLRTNIQNNSNFCTLNTNIDNSRETSSNSICSFAKIVSFTGLLNIFQNKSSINNFNIGLNLCVKISVIFWLVSCSRK